MNKEDQDIELFEAYIANELEGQQLSAFESRLETEQDFLDAFQLYKASVKAAKITGFMSEAKEVIQAKKDQGASQKINYRWLLVAAAVSVLLVSYFALFNTGDQQQLSFNDLYKPYPNIVQMRSDKQSELKNALELYSKADYSKASQLLKNIQPKSDTVYFYMGLSAMSQQKYDQATEVFQKVVVEQSAFRNQLYWYQALIYLKKSDDEKLKLNLMKIDQESKYYNKAKKLLNQLSSK